jgi:hypothetical protein
MGESVIVDDGIFDLFDFGLNFDEELSDAISNSTRKLLYAAKPGCAEYLT